MLVQMQNQTITNSATVSGTDTAGTALVSSSASVTTAEPPPPPSNTGVTTDLAITGKAAHGSGKVNSTNAYTWTISNKGVDAPNVTFRQVIPSGLTFHFSNYHSGNLHHTAGQLAWRDGDLYCSHSGKCRDHYGHGQRGHKCRGNFQQHRYGFI